MVKTPAIVLRKIRGIRTSDAASIKPLNAIYVPVTMPSKHRSRGFNTLVILILLFTVIAGFYYPPLVTGTVAIVIGFFIVRFTNWVIKENRGQLKVFSFWHLLLSSLRFPFYAFPGLLVFAVAAFPLLFVDAITGLAIDSLTYHIQQAGGAVERYLKDAPSPLDLPRYIPWAITKWIIPPTVTTEGSSFISGVVSLIITVSNLLTLLTFAAMILAMIRFLIEIWCRCILASRGAEVSFRLEEDCPSLRTPLERFRTTSSAREVVSIPHGTGFYSTTRLRPHGPRGYGAMPFLFTCPIARVRWGLYRLRFYRAIDKDEGLTYTGGAGAHFIQIFVAEGEQLCVNLAHLVGFSDTIRLRVRWTSRLSAMLLGRLGFVIASGPGTVVMRASGPPEVLNNIEHTADTNQHFDATCLIAWEPTSQFALGASGKLLDVYLEPAFLFVQKSPLTLLNPGDSHHAGIFAKLKSWFIQSVVPV